METKVCTKCNEDKPVGEFYKDASKPSGFRRQCKVCTLNAQKTYRDDNKDKIAAKNKVYYEENKESILKKNAEWKQNNPDYMPEWRESNREHLREYQRAYQRANYNYYLNQSAKRRAKLASVQIEDVKREVVYARDSGTCHICGEPTEPSGWHLDHIIPISKGGSHSYENTAVSHPSCNTKKKDRLL